MFPLLTSSRLASWEHGCLFSSCSPPPFVNHGPEPDCPQGVGQEHSPGGSRLCFSPSSTGPGPMRPSVLRGSCTGNVSVTEFRKTGQSLLRFCCVEQKASLGQPGVSMWHTNCCSSLLQVVDSPQRGTARVCCLVQIPPRASVTGSDVCRPCGPFPKREGHLLPGLFCFPLAGTSLSVVRAAVWVRTGLLLVEDSRGHVCRSPEPWELFRGDLLPWLGPISEREELLLCLC